MNQSITISQLQAENADLLARIAELERLAFTDALTGCYNRHSYDRRVQQLTGNEAWVYIDLCKLGAINNTLGHQVADNVLSTIGRCLRSNIDQVFRTGGDEFVALLQCPLNQAVDIMARVETELSGYQVGGIPVVLAWGVGDSVESADAAMYQHKAECHRRWFGASHTRSAAAIPTPRVHAPAEPGRANTPRQTK